MAVPSDPSFGVGFDADLVRSALTSAMEMGMATLPEDQATFFWKEVGSYEHGGKVPYDLTASPVSIVQAAKTAVIPVAVEFIPRATGVEGTPLGDIQSPRAVLTVLDVHYPTVEGADGVEFSGAKYDVDFVAPVIGLFDMTVYQIYVSAVDEA